MIVAYAALIVGLENGAPKLGVPAADVNTPHAGPGHGAEPPQAFDRRREAGGRNAYRHRARRRRAGRGRVRVGDEAVRGGGDRRDAPDGFAQAIVRDAQIERCRAHNV